MRVMDGVNAHPSQSELDSPITALCGECREAQWCMPSRQCLIARLAKSDAFYASLNATAAARQRTSRSAPPYQQNRVRPDQQNPGLQTTDGQANAAAQECAATIRAPQPITLKSSS